MSGFCSCTVTGKAVFVGLNGIYLAFKISNRVRPEGKIECDLDLGSGILHEYE